MNDFDFGCGHIACCKTGCLTTDNFCYTMMTNGTSVGHRLLNEILNENVIVILILILSYL
ncbi:hypothetical protein [Neodiprion abietis nucleopolyhedrovirus]|uniref:Uncharacterized protein n=1 Tax=Neodiprion abietis nucleopolyhedrovirus TaxID=204507 RepID=Q0ZP49_9CBAC|nr:hypothetical protein [Neodiprion abietis nucleopolyhedrovirus]ABC74905.1 unknown [Neodiprion abietis nucleopolyhedrovirus]